MPLIGGRGTDLLQGETFTLFASAVRDTAIADPGQAGTAVYLGGERKRYIFFLALTNAGDNGSDTLDVFVDFSVDNVTYYNAVHFTQILGNGANTLSFFTVCDPTGGLTADVNVTADASVHVTRPAVFGPYVRGRYILVNGGGTHTFTFSLTGYAQ